MASAVPVNKHPTLIPYPSALYSNHKQAITQWKDRHNSKRPCSARYVDPKRRLNTIYKTRHNSVRALRGTSCKNDNLNRFDVVISKDKPKCEGALGPFSEGEYKQVLRIDYWLEANYNEGLTDNEVKFIKRIYLEKKDDEIIQDSFLVKSIFLKREMARGDLTKSRKKSLEGYRR